MLAQARQELGEVAGAVADVELVAEDVVPAVAAGAGGAREAEDVGTGGDAGVGARLERGGADLRVAQHPEQLAEAGDALLGDLGQGFGRDVAAGHAGAAGGDHHLDGGIGDPGAELGRDRALVVADDGARREAVAGGLKAGDEGVAGTVIGGRARVGDGQDRDRQRLERDGLVDSPGHGGG